MDTLQQKLRTAFEEGRELLVASVIYGDKTRLKKWPKSDLDKCSWNTWVISKDLKEDFFLYRPNLYFAICYNVKIKQNVWQLDEKEELARVKRIY